MIYDANPPYDFWVSLSETRTHRIIFGRDLLFDSILLAQKIDQPFAFHTDLLISVQILDHDLT